MALGIVATAIVCAGCASGEDRAFTSAVVPVLVQAAKLESTTTIALPTRVDYSIRYIVESDGERALGKVKVFQLGVRRPPHPTRRELRYLRAKLERLGEAAEGLVRASIRSRASMMPYGIPVTTTMGWVGTVHRAAKYEGMWRTRFLDAGSGVTVAERIAIKSSVLMERRAPTGVERESEVSEFGDWSDSLLTEMERVARAEFSAGGTARP
jgi:hypothetical protein